MKQRVLSGMRATGRLHLGNYLGAAKGMLALQERDDLETIYMVADVHTLTTPYSVTELTKDRRQVIIDYLSVGLDPQKSILFQQSMVPEHLELAFYFSSVMSIARMQHLPTFKDKVKQHPDHATMALLNYPLLMAADMLIYQASLVPVGTDQEPHLEIAREVARKMNAEYGMSFPEPVRFATEGEYVPSLLGSGKMSKTVEGSAINLTDSLDTILAKLKKAPTDSGSGSEVPTEGGVAYLFKLVGLIEGKPTQQMYEAEYLGSGVKYGKLKEQLAQAIFEMLKPIQTKREELEVDVAFVDTVIADGAKRAQELAQQTVTQVRTAMGLR